MTDQQPLFDTGSPSPLPRAANRCTPLGTGPEGETCRTCAHLVRLVYNRTVLKCGKVKHHWTGGKSTDIKAKWPACGQWQAKAANA